LYLERRREDSMKRTAATVDYDQVEREGKALKTRFNEIYQ
jgi:hypothetical protein